MSTSRLGRTAARETYDQVLAEVWRAKDALSQSCGHDVSVLFAEARRRQAAGEPRRPLLTRGERGERATAERAHETESA